MDTNDLFVSTMYDHKIQKIEQIDYEVTIRNKEVLG